MGIFYWGIGMKISASLITYNEQEMLPRALRYLLSLDVIDEICVLDSNSTDMTQEILRGFQCDRLKWSTDRFESFSEHRNKCIEMCSGDWIVSMDADETYSAGFAGMLASECVRTDVTAIRIPTIVLAVDENHYLDSGNLDPHIRVWRKGVARFEKKVHELLVDDRGRILHECHDRDIVNSLHQYPNVFMKHAQMLKSVSSLDEKGERWDSLGMIEESARRGLPIHKGIWSEWKRDLPVKCSIREIPERWR